MNRRIALAGNILVDAVKRVDAWPEQGRLATIIGQERACGGAENGVPYEGKEETFRVRRGTCLLYVDGEGSRDSIRAALPPTDVTVFHEVVLHEGAQYTLRPGTNHWFQAGPEGAVVSEFSTKSRDESDLFTDRRIRRIPEVEE